MINMVEQNNIQAVYVDDLSYRLVADTREQQLIVGHVVEAYVKGVLNKSQPFSTTVIPAGDWRFGKPTKLYKILHAAAVTARHSSPLTVVIAVDGLGRLPLAQLTTLDRMMETVAMARVFPPVEPIKT